MGNLCIFILSKIINRSKLHFDITFDHYFVRWIWQRNYVLLILQSISNVIVKDKWTTLFCMVHPPSQDLMLAGNCWELI